MNMPCRMNPRSKREVGEVVIIHIDSVTTHILTQFTDSIIVRLKSWLATKVHDTGTIKLANSAQ